MHNHGKPSHPDEMGVWSEFQIIYEESPDLAQRIVEQSASMLNVNRRLADRLGSRAAVIAGAMDEVASRDHAGQETDLADIAIAYGCLRVAAGNLLQLVQATADALASATGCLDPDCPDAWIRFTNPPDLQSMNDEPNQFFIPGLGTVSLHSGSLDELPEEMAGFVEFLQSAVEDFMRRHEG